MYAGACIKPEHDQADKQTNKMSYQLGLIVCLQSDKGHNNNSWEEWEKQWVHIANFLLQLFRHSHAKKPVLPKFQFVISVF